MGFPRAPTLTALAGPLSSEGPESWRWDYPWRTGVWTGGSLQCALAWGRRSAQLAQSIQRMFEAAPCWMRRPNLRKHLPFPEASEGRTLSFSAPGLCLGSRLAGLLSQHLAGRACGAAACVLQQCMNCICLVAASFVGPVSLVRDHVCLLICVPRSPAQCLARGRHATITC